MNKQQIKTEERGFVLVTALMLIMILTILGITASYKTVVETKTAVVIGDLAKTTEIANAGLNQLFWYWNAQGQDNTYAGFTDLTSTIASIQTGTVGQAYVPALTSETLAGLDAAATAANGGTAITMDEFIVASTNVRVYEYFDSSNVRVASSGNIPTQLKIVANNTWNTAANRHVEQVAVWVTAYDKPSGSDYPYGAANAACTGKGCHIVVYALGRKADTKRLVRESQGFSQQQLTGVSAMTNASPYGSFDQQCKETDPVTDTGSSNVAAWNDDTKNTVINVTQAPYTSTVNPSGTAIQSNTAIGGGSKGFRDGNNSTMGTTFEWTPMLLYSGHGDTEAANQTRADLASVPKDTNPVRNLDVITAAADNMLPNDLVVGPLIGSGDDPLTYFSDANAQLFNLDAYRWAAEQFTCQNTTLANGVGGNGRYCSNAELLRLSIDDLFTDKIVSAPVSGRITVAEFEYNTNHSIPMFGIVRVMMPTTSSGNALKATDGTVCTVNGVTYNSFFYNISSEVATMTTQQNPAIEAPPSGTEPTWPTTEGETVTDGSIIWTAVQDTNFAGTTTPYVASTANYALGAAVTPDPSNGYVYVASIDYDGTPEVVDSDGTMDGEARVLVYGSLFFDFFTDNGTGNDPGGNPYAGNFRFDPAAGERLLVPIEAADSYMKIEYPILVNPSMPDLTSVTALAFPTAAGSPATIASTAGAAVQLASPTNGFFPASEGLLPPTNSDTYAKGLVGTMRLMEKGVTKGLLKVVNDLEASATTTPTMATTLFNGDTDALEYYYNLMVANANQDDDFSWPIAPFPGSISGDFSIGKDDYAQGNNDGDRYHLLFPSGYMHGWKVALAALDLKASDWNTLLTGLGTETAASGQHETHRNYGYGVGDAGVTINDKRPKGSPFHTTTDPGFAQAATLETNQNNYFKVASMGNALPLRVKNKKYHFGTYVRPDLANGFVYKAVSASTIGQSAASEPAWPATAGSTVLDGGVMWLAFVRGAGGIADWTATTAYPFGSVVQPVGLGASPMLYRSIAVVGTTENTDTQPTWPTTAGNTVNDGDPSGDPYHVIWEAVEAKSASVDYAWLNSDWQDIPGEMYVGGLLDMHAHSNINGIVYTPGPLEWEPGNSKYGGDNKHLSYINGTVITGYGAYLKNSKSVDAKYVLTYSNEASDNINTNNTVITMRRFSWQELK